MLGGTIFTSHLFLQNSRLPSPNNIFFKEAMATKNVASQASKKNIGSLSRTSYQAGTIPKILMHEMETRRLAKATMVVVIRRIVALSPKQQDLLQKLSYWMGQSPSKLSTPLYEVEGYYSSDSSSPSLK